MTDNKSTISYEELINKMNEKTTTTKTIKALGENIEVKTVLSMEEFEETFNRIIALIYGDDGKYIPIARDFAVRLCTVFAYTNVPFPKDIEEIFGRLFDLMYNTEFYISVVKVVDEGQYEALLRAVNEEIKYRNSSRIERINSQINNLSLLIESLGNQFKEMFADVSEEDIKKLADAIQNGGIDEGRLVKAYADYKLEGDVDG